MAEANEARKPDEAFRLLRQLPRYSDAVSKLDAPPCAKAFQDALVGDVRVFDQGIGGLLNSADLVLRNMDKAPANATINMPKPGFIKRDLEGQLALDCPP